MVNVHCTDYDNELSGREISAMKKRNSLFLYCLLLMFGGTKPQSWNTRLPVDDAHDTNFNKASFVTQ